MKNFKALLVLFVFMFAMLAVYLVHFRRNAIVREFSESAYHPPTNEAGALFKEKQLVLWSNDYHISPINDLKHLLSPFGVKFIDKSLSGHCHITNTCGGRSTLKVIGVGNAMDLDHSLIPKFYDAYKDDAEMKSVDAFVCFHPTSMCELFAPFNKSLIIIASTRYELGRFGKDRWTKWNENLIQYASLPWNVVGGNNMYDVEYIKYFTGIQGQLLSSFCDYNNLTYNPSRKGFLVAPIHNGGFNTIFFAEFSKACLAMNCTVEATALRQKYPHYKYSDLTAHMGMVYVPYQVSVMSLFEQYRMNIPMFFPSRDLLTKWQHQHMIMNERTWKGVFGGKPDKSDISAHSSQIAFPDPNNEQDEKAILHWIEFSDFYQFPHILYYDSIPDLVKKLQNVELAELLKVSNQMKEYNLKAKTELLEKWKDILLRVAEHSVNKPH